VVPNKQGSNRGEKKYLQAMSKSVICSSRTVNRRVMKVKGNEMSGTKSMQGEWEMYSKWSRNLTVRDYLECIHVMSR